MGLRQRPCEPYVSPCIGGLLARVLPLTAEGALLPPVVFRAHLGVRATIAPAPADLTDDPIMRTSGSSVTRGEWSIVNIV